jgi:hypothetical protein
MTTSVAPTAAFGKGDGIKANREDKPEQVHLGGRRL